jgi:hypothetical protein
VNRIDQETEKEARAHKGYRAIQEEEEEEEEGLASRLIGPLRMENPISVTKLVSLPCPE